MEAVYDVRPGRGHVHRLRRRVGRRALLHRLRAAADRGDDGALRGQAGRHPRRRRVLAGRRRARGQGAVHRADRLPRHQEGGPRRRRCSPTTTSPPSRRCSSPASGSTPRPGRGLGEARRAGGRPLVADRDRLADRGEPARPGADASSRPGSPSVPVPGYQIEILDVDGSELPRRRGGRDRHQAAAAAGLPADAVGATTSGSASRTCRATRATTSPATAATSTRTATSSSWAAPTTSSTSPATACRPARWRRCSPGHPDVAECAVIGVDDQLKGQVPRGFVVLKAGVTRGRGRARAGAGGAGARPRSGAVASFKDVAVVPALPKTRSGKVLRKTMRGSPTAQDAMVPSTIDDAAVLDTLRPVLQKGPGADGPSASFSSEGPLRSNRSRGGARRSGWRARPRD